MEKGGRWNSDTIVLFRRLYSLANMDQPPLLITSPCDTPDIHINAMTST